MADLTELQGKRILDDMMPLLGDNQEQKDLMEQVVHLLALPDDEFEVLAPMILQKYQQSLNNPNDKIALAQAANAAGLTMEDLVAGFRDLVIQVEETSLPVIKRDFLKELVMSIVNAINDTQGIAKKTMTVFVERMNEDVRLPEYVHESDSGMDIFALEDVTVHPGEKILVHTGIKVALPPGYELQVRPKSGRCLKTQLRVANAPGTIDQGYRDEVCVIIENIDPPIKAIHFGRPYYDETGATIGYDESYFGPGCVEYGSDFTIGKGEKFAQLVLCEVPKVAWQEVSKVSEIGEDRMGGFGSTGLK